MSGALTFVRALANVMPLAMTARAATILLHLSDRGGTTDTCKALLNATGMSPPSLSRALDTLSALGYVQRLDRPKRSNHPLHVQLTSKGLGIVGKIEDAFAAAAALPSAHIRRGKVSA